MLLKFQTYKREKEQSQNVGGMGGVLQNETDLLTMAIKALIIYTYTFALHHQLLSVRVGTDFG